MKYLILLVIRGAKIRLYTLHTSTFQVDTSEDVVDRSAATSMDLVRIYVLHLALK